MTAFSSAKVEKNGISLELQMQSVNRKHLDVVLNLPHELKPFAALILKLCKKSLHRGAVSLVWNLDCTEDKAPHRIRLNEPLLKQWISLFEGLGQGNDSLTERCIPHLISHPDLVSTQIFWEDETEVEAIIEEVTSKALEGLVQVKAKEGMDLSSVVGGLTHRLPGLLDKVKKLNESRPEALRTKFLEKLNEVSDLLSWDESRLNREIALIVERSDIQEEIDRFGLHLENLNSHLSKGVAPLGKKLDFICQELLRETNTISSKTSDFLTTEACIEIKTYLEQIREQIQNIE